VGVVEHEQQPAPGREPLEQAGDGAVRIQPGGAAQPLAERGEDRAELRRRLGREALELEPVERG
jgi:hypothetical protein